MAIEWLTNEIAAEVIPNIERAGEYIGTKSNGAYFILKNIGDFPKDFSGQAEFDAFVAIQMPSVIGKINQVPGFIKGIGSGMYEGDKNSLADFMRKISSQKASLDSLKAKSIIYSQTGNKNPSQQEIDAVKNKGLENYNAKNLSPDAADLLHTTETGANPVLEFFAGFVSGGASYVDETANGILGAGAFLWTLATTDWSKEDVWTKAVQASYNAQVVNLSGGWDSLMIKAGVNIDSGAYAVGKWTGNITASTVTSIMIPGGGATRAFQITTAATTTFGTTIRNDVNALGGVDNISTSDAKAISAHASARSAIAGGTSWLTSKVNSSERAGQYTAGDLGAKGYTDAWKKGLIHISNNVGANTAISFGSNLTEQAVDYGYRNYQYGDGKIDFAKAGGHALASTISSTATNAINMANNDRHIYPGVSSQTKKVVQTTKSKVAREERLEFISKGTSTVGKAARSIVSYGAQEMSKDHAIINNTIKVTAATSGKMLENAVSNIGKK